MGSRAGGGRFRGSRDEVEGAATSCGAAELSARERQGRCLGGAGRKIRCGGATRGAGEVAACVESPPRPRSCSTKCLQCNLGCATPFQSSHCFSHRSSMTDLFPPAVALPLRVVSR